MDTPSRSTWRTVTLALMLLAAAPSAMAQPPADLSGPDLELRRQVMARFAVVPLKEGIALSGATPERRVEIDNGLVMAGGVPLSGDELRRRLGADASVVLRLSYLDNAALRRLFAPPAAPAQPTPPVTPAVVAAPPPPAPPLPPAVVPAPPAPPVGEGPRTPAGSERVYRRTGARLALGKAIVVEADEDVTDAVVAVGGNVRIEGRVSDDVLVIGGDLELTPTAEVRGDITVLGGDVTMTPGARHTGELHHGMVGRFPNWRWPTVGWSRFDMGPGTRWLSLAGTLTRVMLLALAVALVMFLARSRVMRIGAAAAATPVRAGLIGLLTQVLFIPVLVAAAVALAVTIIGIPFVAVLIPLAVVALGVAMLLGFTSLAQRVGQAIGGRAGRPIDAAGWAAVLGVGVIVLPTVLSRLVGLGPDWVRFGTVMLLGLGAAVEYLAWTIGLGAAVMTGLGRWAVVPPPVPPHAAVDAPSAL